MSLKQRILDHIDRGQLASALRLIAEGIDLGDNTAVEAKADQALAENVTQDATLADHEQRIETLEP